MSRRTALWTLFTLLAATAACGPAEVEEAPEPAATAESAVIRMRDGGEIWISFSADKAPGHVENFAKLARSGYYDGTTFHRVIPEFMIQGGDHLSKDDDPTNDGTGTPGYFLPAEFNDVPHRRGIVAMARRDHPDSAGAQFYIVVADDPAWREVLDGKYTVFGEVSQGMDVADRIASVPRDVSDRPLEPQTMESVTIRPAIEEQVP